MFDQVSVQHIVTIALGATVVLSFVVGLIRMRRGAGQPSEEDLRSNDEKKVLEEFGIVGEPRGFDYDYRAARQVVEKVLKG